MDSITQATLGAVIGQSVSPKLGRRALFWGAVGGTIPDLDVLAALFVDPIRANIYHRGFTHSLWFGPLVGLVLGLLLFYWHRKSHLRKKNMLQTGPNIEPGAPQAKKWWVVLMIFAITTHPLLDWQTSYGTQLLAPFSRARFSLNSVAIVDFFYTGVLLLAFLVGLFFKARRKVQTYLALVALLITSIYLGYGYSQNQKAKVLAKESLAQNQIEYQELNSYPTLLQPYLRRLVAIDANRNFYITYLSTYQPHKITWQKIAVQKHPLVKSAFTNWQMQTFEWFTQGFWHLRLIEQTNQQKAIFYFDDLRYGVIGRPEKGLWGIKAIFDEQKNEWVSFERVRYPVEMDSDELLDTIFKASLKPKEYF